LLEVLSSLDKKKKYDTILGERRIQCKVEKITRRIRKGQRAVEALILKRRADEEKILRKEKDK
jgi:hypothetical protein